MRQACCVEFSNGTVDFQGLQSEECGGEFLTVRSTFKFCNAWCAGLTFPMVQNTFSAYK